MNINSNELLLKKVKFGEEQSNKPTAIKETVTNPVETLSPDAAMNALNFQGLNNVVSNPELATELKMMNEEVATQEEAQNTTSNEETDQSNVSFQARSLKMSPYKGKTSTLKSMAFAALMALGMLGGSAALQSCDKETITQSVTVDMDAIVAVITQLQALLQEMKEQQQITNNQLIQMNKYMEQLMEEVKNGNLNADQFYQKMFEYMVENSMNQQIIIDQLAQNGMTQEEANKLIRELIEQVKSGQTSAEAAWNKIQDLLGDIKGLLGQVLTSLQKAEQDRAELKTIAEDIRTSSYVSNAQQDKLIKQNNILIESNKEAIEKLQTISAQIEKANLDSNANFDKVISTLNMSKDQLINVMIKIGYTQAQIEKMTAAQILAAIKENTSVTQNTNSKLEQIISELQSGKIDAKAAADKIIDLLGDIKSILTQVLSSLQKAEQDRAELKTIANDIRKSSYVSNAQQAKLIEQNNTLIESNKEVITNLNTISEQIEKANLDSNANFDKVINTLNMSRDQLIGVMVKIGYTQAQIERMTAAQILAAIKENTNVTKNTNNKLEQILSELQSGKIDAKAAADKIIKLLGEINKNILALTDSFNNFVKDYKSDKNKAMKMLGEILKNGKVQTSILSSISKTQKDMASNIAGIKSNTDALLEIAQDDTKYNELIKTLKEIQTSGSTSIDYQKFEQMFKLLNMNLTDAINMSRSELIAAIKDFEHTYIETEQKQTEELQTIQSKIDDLQIFISNNNNKDIINAINKLTQTINNGNTDVTAELKNIEAQLKKLQTTVDAILKSIGEQASKTDVYFKKWDNKFDEILGKLDNFKSQLTTIIANQKTAQIYLNSLQKEVENLKVEIKNIQNQGGTGVDYNKLDEMWKEHDKANYEKYSKLIKDLGLDTSKLKTVEDLLKSIDSKMDNIKDNSDILTKILNKLNDFETKHPDYNGKLDKIIELLKKFKFNCNCGNNNEGILGELDKILG